MIAATFKQQGDKKTTEKQAAETAKFLSDAQATLRDVVATRISPELLPTSAGAWIAVSGTAAKNSRCAATPTAIPASGARARGMW